MERRILVIDDNAVTAKLTEASLRREGHVVIIVNCGAAARKVLARETVDLILMDIQLRDATGIALIKQIRSRPQTSNVPVLVLTAETSLSIANSTRDSGANGYLVKPCPLAALIKRVEELLFDAA